MKGAKAPSLSLEAANDREAARAQIAENRAAARALFAGLDGARLLRRPAPRAWSVAECLLHLNRSGTIYLASIDRGIAEGRNRGLESDGPYRHPWFSRWFIASLEPGRGRYPAPRIFVPPEPSGPPSEILAGFEALGRAVDERIDASRGLDLGRVRVVSPVSPLVRISLGMAFALLTTHERRHLDQARRAADALAPAAGGGPDFPRG